MSKPTSGPAVSEPVRLGSAHRPTRAYRIAEAIATGGYSLLTRSPESHHSANETQGTSWEHRIAEAIATGGYSLLHDSNKKRAQTDRRAD